MRPFLTLPLTALCTLAIAGLALANPEMAKQAEQNTAAPAPAAAPAPVAEPAAGQPPAGHPAMPPAQPAAAPAAAAKPETKMVGVSGKVVQTISSGGYAYVFVKQKNGKKVWVAIPEMKVTVGEEASFEPGMEMTNFQSTTLKRTFDKIIFSGGPVAGKKGKTGKDAKKEQKGTRGSAGAVVAVADEKIKVKKATGANAYTVAEIFKNKDKLKNKKVAINAKVVKVSSGIMNRNWIHIQDGTGGHQTGDNDLVVTSDAIPSIGDTVTVKGTLVRDKDFGSGYKYAVMVEQAEIIIQ